MLSSDNHTSLIVSLEVCKDLVILLLSLAFKPQVTAHAAGVAEQAKLGQHQNHAIVLQLFWPGDVVTLSQDKHHVQHAKNKWAAQKSVVLPVSSM